MGQLVQHRMFNYRGVIVDVDPEFAGDDEWYEQIKTSRPPKDQPWYKILVEATETQTYVSELNLLADGSGEPLQNAYLHVFFNGFEDGRYNPKRVLN